MARASGYPAPATVSPASRVDAAVTNRVAQRLACLCASVVSALVALIAATTATGLLGCYGDSCSYELRGYTAHGPNALYGVMGGAAGLLATVALVGCAVGLRGGIGAGRARPALVLLAVVVSGTAAFAFALHGASA